MASSQWTHPDSALNVQCFAFGDEGGFFDGFGQRGGGHNRHDVVAFDQLQSATRTTSIAQSLKDTIVRLKPDEEALLIAIAKGEPVENEGSENSVMVQARLQRLANLALVDPLSRPTTVHPLVQAYLLVEGRLVELGSHDELFAARGVYHHLHSLQVNLPVGAGAAK